MICEHSLALTGISPQISALQPAYGGGQALVDLKAVGVRGIENGGAPVIQFAIATYGERAHPAYPGEFDIYVDSNGDGQPDYVIFNSELGGFGATGQTVVNIANVATGTVMAKYYAQAELGSANMIYTVDAADLGLSSLSQPFNFSVQAFDNYFTGSQTDGIGNMSYTPALPKYSLGVDSLSVARQASVALPVSMPTGGAAASPAQQGFLLMHYNGLTGREASVISITP